MSGHMSGQARALPFTGPAGALLTMIGLAVSGLTFVARRLRREDEA
jgi:hypothetical protein